MYNLALPQVMAAWLSFVLLAQFAMRRFGVGVLMSGGVVYIAFIVVYVLSWRSVVLLDEVNFF